MTEMWAVERTGDTVTPTPYDWEDPAEVKANGPTDEALKYVALVYRFAFAVGDGPTQAVAEYLELPRSTAGRWVSQARERGYLGAAEERKAGVG